MIRHFIFSILLLMLHLPLQAQHTLPATILPSCDTGTPGVVSLNGTWRFLMLTSGKAMPPAGWLDCDFNDSGWSLIKVPGNWETQGFKHPEYGADLTDCAGLYRTSFMYQPEWKGQNVVLRFDGVHMGFECWINGQLAGSFGSANNPCNFNVTPFLKDGRNVLCVKVASRSKVWRYDTVDNWTFCGINRDVTVFGLPYLHIEDLTFASTNCRNGKADISIKVKTNDSTGTNRLRVSLVNSRGIQLAGSEQAIHHNGVSSVNMKLSGVDFWTAETPVCYTLEAGICDAEGRVLHHVSRRVGIREIKSAGREILLNNVPLKLHGVCVSEAHPFLGNSFTAAEWEKQLRLMKKAHINFIRTAHYPMHPAFYDLCDEMGFYVCDEIPLASRGEAYLKDKSYNDLTHHRVYSTIDRDKNHPCVIIWSIGNENKYVAADLATLVKNYDSTRLRGFPQTIGVLTKMIEQPVADVNVLMGHYLNESQLDYVARNARLPFLQTEYSHSLGLAFGDFEQKWQRIQRTKEFAGGSVWCWMDGAALTRRPQGEPLKGLVLDSLHYLDSFGYDRREGEPEKGKEANDGIVYANGLPQEDYWLVRKLYSPVQIEEDTLRQPLRITIANGYDFRSLEGYTLSWELRSLQKIICSGEKELDGSPHEKKSLTIDVEKDLSPYKNVYLYASVKDNDTGETVYERSLPVVSEQTDFITTMYEAENDKRIMAKVTKDGLLMIKDKSNGDVLMNSSFYLRVGRRYSQVLKYRTGNKSWQPYILNPKVLCVERKHDKRGQVTTLRCVWSRVDHPEQSIDGQVDVLVCPNGLVDINYELNASAQAQGVLTECGLTLMADEAVDCFHWLGKGLYSSVPGKTRHNEYGFWHLHRDDYRFSGNRADVDLALLTGENGGGILLKSGNGNIAVDTMNGKIVVSQNLHVSGYGSKSTVPIGLMPLQELKNKCGRFVLLPRSKAQMEHSAAKQLLVQEQCPVPSIPFQRGYAW